MVLVNTPLGREGRQISHFGLENVWQKFKARVEQQGWLLTLSTGMLPAPESRRIFPAFGS